jgi:RHS repeat-associated protein
MYTALVLTSPWACFQSGATSYYEADGLGSVTSLTSSAGAIANTYTYDSFGKQTASSGSVTNPFRYTGREFDTETNLYYNRARYYDPTTGRFLGEDPIRFKGGNNFYVYVRNNPVKLVDPSGLCPPQAPTSPCDQPGTAASPSDYQELGQSAAFLNSGINASGFFINLANLANFAGPGSLNAQNYGSSPAYANYVYGVYLSASGMSLSTALTGANLYGQFFSNYAGKNLTMDATYTNIPAANVANIIAGYNAQQNGTLCSID